ncbi:MAG: hypothetical protein EXR99_07220 [Gemmataceae bacterium]|nr:hypothetical protein [Gemmataceae bacterium]
MRDYSHFALVSLFLFGWDFSALGQGEKAEKKPAGSWPGSVRVATRFTELKSTSFTHLDPKEMEKILDVFQSPTIKVQGPCEEFTAQPDLYEWLLENPDKVVSLWRLLGAQCANIEREGSGGFVSADGKGTRMEFRLLLAKKGLRVWHASGNGKLAPLLPAVPVEALVVLHYQAEKGERIKQQLTVYAKTDSKAAALITRVLGASVPMATQKVISQMQMFFGAMAWYLEKHPERGENLLKAVLVTQTGKPGS